MARESIDEIDETRRRNRISWEGYAQMLKGHPEGVRLLREFRLIGGRDRQGRLRDLEDLGRLGKD